MYAFAPGPFTQDAVNTRMGRLVRGGMLLGYAVLNPGLVALLALSPALPAPEGLAGALAYGALGLGLYTLCWWPMLRWARLDAAHTLALGPERAQLGSVQWPYADLRVLHVADGLGTLGSPGAPRGGDTLHLQAGPWSKRLTLGPEQAQAALAALADRCPQAVVIGEDGLARGAAGGWSVAQERVARRFFLRRSLRSGALALFGGVMVLGGLAAVLRGSSGGAGTLVFLPVLVYGVRGVRATGARVLRPRGA